MDEKTHAILSQLAEKLDVTTSYLWSALLKQAPIDAICQSATLILFACAAIVCVYMSFKLFKTANLSADWSLKECVLVLFLSLTFISFVACLIQISNHMISTVAGFFNPEYWALEEITKLFKK